MTIADLILTGLVGSLFGLLVSVFRTTQITYYHRLFGSASFIARHMAAGAVLTVILVVALALGSRVTVF